MLTISVRNSRHIPQGPITEITLTLGTRRRPWCNLRVHRFPDRRPEATAMTGKEQRDG